PCTDPDPEAGACFSPTPDLAGCSDTACCNAVCEAVPFCCVVGWEEPCTEAAFDICQRVYHAVYAFAVSGARLEGLTVSGGQADGPGYWDTVGGGMLARNADPLLVRCTFEHNVAAEGGGLFLFGATADSRIVNCTFLRNTAGTGGAVSVAYGGPRLVNVLLAAR
ncbi:MAG: hypothetical protein ACE5JG_10970, partial [Planctomycetota bacterium]